ncbi:MULTISPECIES: FliM/FliN family flagellar motor switch protein [Halocynthiibacter]|uniref:FliM/FliN family flagellar motor switch protein n=1 Tax=Halocynthiibacter halioticoli TaxID=2986804 RepID=A0AAE3IXH2_9RHOB|nr:MULTISPECIES: FliM/FliN family flagellar motor switch protein [Halocynthiibacter]MCV6823945.1 FliM/FliN family flagellar motor switch protein [Halocynthiibacter halioticoli]MCW4056946.1 FliM/FliN family flagellar motor switch protein [Halocynthiibacter sp. SDUM655004]
MSSRELLGAEGESVIRRMLRTFEPQEDPRGSETIRALRSALPKAADSAFDLPLEVTGLVAEDVQREPLIEKIEDGQLMLLLQARDSRLAIAVPDANMLAALIEIQTMGCVSKTEGADRKPTRTDAALAEPFFEVLLAEFLHQLEGSEDMERFAGFGVYRSVDERRHLPLLLAEAEYHVFTVDVDLGQGAKQGRILLGFPELQRPEERPSEETEKAAWTEAMHKNVMQGEAVLDAQLFRLSLNVEALESLQVGQELEIPRQALTHVELVGLDGKTALTGKLGQSDGRRAVMITDGEKPSLPVVDSQEPQISDNPLSALGADYAPPPMTSLLASQPEGTGVPDDLSELSPPPEEELPSLPMADLPQAGLEENEQNGGLDALPDLGELPPMDMSALDDLPLTID